MFGVARPCTCSHCLASYRKAPQPPARPCKGLGREASVVNSRECQKPCCPGKPG